MKLDDLKKTKRKNPVAKNMGINKARTHKDKKKALRNPRKNQKHKGRIMEGFYALLEDNHVWTKEEIREKLKTDDRWLFRGLLAIYRLQTEDEKNDKATRHYNGIGFNGVNADFLSTAAERRMNPNFKFSRKYRDAIRRAMLKYSGQLAKIANGKIDMRGREA
jgi:hypothetical protein